MGSCEQGKQKTGKALQPACLMSVLVRAKTLSSPCRGDVSSGPAHTCGLVLALRVKRGTLIGRHVILNPRGWHGVLALSISRAARSTEGEVCLLPLRQRRPCPLKETQGRELHAHRTAYLVSGLKGIHSRILHQKRSKKSRAQVCHELFMDGVVPVGGLFYQMFKMKAVGQIKSYQAKPVSHP